MRLEIKFRAPHVYSLGPTMELPPTPALLTITNLDVDGRVFGEDRLVVGIPVTSQAELVVVRSSRQFGQLRAVVEEENRDETRELVSKLVGTAAAVLANAMIEADADAAGVVDLQPSEARADVYAQLIEQVDDGRLVGLPMSRADMAFALAMSLAMIEELRLRDPERADEVFRVLFLTPEDDDLT